MKPVHFKGLGLLVAAAYFLHAALTPTAWHFIDNANLIFHEAGHALFIFFPNFIHVLMGSGFQVLLPLLIACYFFFSRQLLSAAVCLMWCGQNLVNVSVYAGDAVLMQLPLLGGDSSMHDWNYLLGTLHVLQYTPQIAAVIYDAGLGVILLGIAVGLYALTSFGSGSRVQ